MFSLFTSKQLLFLPICLAKNTGLESWSPSRRVASRRLLNFFFLNSNDYLDAVLSTDLGEQRCFKFLIRAGSHHSQKPKLAHAKTFKNLKAVYTHTVKHLFTRLMSWHAKCPLPVSVRDCITRRLLKLSSITATQTHLSSPRETRLRMRAIVKWLSKNQNQSNRVITFDSRWKLL